VLAGGSLALGDAYVDGWWDVKSLDQFFDRLLSARLQKEISFSWPLFWVAATSFLFNLQSKSRAFEVGEKHYDIGNDVYEAMLDKRMVYTCGYWRNAKNLNDAQEAKLNLVCKKIGLKKGDHVLDIGCGWGSFLQFAAEEYQAKGTGLTVSKNQAILAKDRCHGLPIEFKLQDYRDMKGQTFDHIISLGMFEHVGPKNYRTYMEKAYESLKDNGLFLLHTIGSNISVVSTDPWIEKYIFPNGILPSIKQIGKSIEGLFVMEDWHNFGADYDKTLMAWFENFDAHWDELKHNYSDRFYRMWKYYLLCMAGAFRSRNMQLWQIVLSKKGVRGGYKSIR
jgi:cyclopropane-fatty-acyl-phospholipid synthase